MLFKQCHGWGSPAVRIACSNWSMTELTLAIDAGNQVGTIPTELALLTNLGKALADTGLFLL